MAKSKKVDADESVKQGLGALAAASSRKYIQDACTEVGLTVKVVAKAVVEALQAKYHKAQLGPDGQFVVSQAFIDHPTRLKAVERAEVLLDLKPVDRKQVAVESLLTDDQLDGAISAIIKKGKAGGK